VLGCAFPPIRQKKGPPRRRWVTVHFHLEFFQHCRMPNSVLIFTGLLFPVLCFSPHHHHWLKERSCYSLGDSDQLCLAGEYFYHGRIRELRQVGLRAVAKAAEG
jgi:hypothetical protein